MSDAAAGKRKRWQYFRAPSLVALAVFVVLGFVCLIIDVSSIKQDYLYPPYVQSFFGGHSGFAILAIIRVFLMGILGMIGALGAAVFVVAAVSLFIGPVIYLIAIAIGKKEFQKTEILDNSALLFQVIVISFLLFVVGFGQSILQEETELPDDKPPSSYGRFHSLEVAAKTKLLNLFGIELPADIYRDDVAASINKRLSEIEWPRFEPGKNIAAIRNQWKNLNVKTADFAIMDEDYALDFWHWVMLPGRLRALEGNRLNVVVRFRRVWDTDSSTAKWVRIDSSGNTKVMRKIRIPIDDIEIYDLRDNSRCHKRIEGSYEGLDIALRNLARTGLTDQQIHEWEEKHARSRTDKFFSWVGLEINKQVKE